jgi:hypothetical protein
MAKHQRDRGREALWRKRLAKHAASGLSVRAFCRREKLSEASFYGWRRTIGSREAEGKSQARRNGRSTRPAFLPVVVNAGCDDTIAIELGGGRVLRLPASTTVERLAALVHALEARAER